MLSDPTVSELARRIDSLESRMAVSFRAIDDRITSAVVPRDLYVAQLENLSKRLDRTEARYDADAAWRRAVLLGVALSVFTSGASIVASLIH